MSALDIAVLVILAYFLLRGIFRGLIKEVVGILGLFVAFWAASVYWELGADQLKPVFNSEIYRAVLSFIAIYLIVYFLIGLMSVFVDKIVKVTITPFTSGMAGAVLGLVKGVILCLIILAASTAFLKPDHTFYTDSFTWTVGESLSDRLKEWMPQTLKGLFAANAPRGQSASVRMPLQQAPVSAPASASNQAQSRKPTLPTNYQEMVSLVQNFPSQIKPEWRERIYSLAPESVDADVIRSFIQANPELFGPPPAPPAGTANGTAAGAAAPPSWPSPARE